MLQTQLGREFMASILGTAEFIADRIGPRVAQRYSVRIEKNKIIPTWDQKTTLIDIYTPLKDKPKNGWPIALMIHGGGFRFFSKNSHAQIAARVAEMGYLTIALDYRLAPKNPYPEGLIDTLSVYDWVQKEAQNLGGNKDQIVLVAESAGANFALNICLLAHGLATAPFLPNPSPTTNWTAPKKAVLHCGYHQASGSERYNFENTPSSFVRSRARMVQFNYLPESVKNPEKKDWGLADPLIILEKHAESGQTLSSFTDIFIPVGGNDPVLEDSFRLSKVFTRFSKSHQYKVYPNSPHAFYAMPWDKNYQDLWIDIAAFLKLS